MRKTSQDGGDSSSITSGIENEIKKTGAIIRTKRNSIKRKVQSLSHESDDAVIEPLLQKEKQKADTSNQSAKNNLLSKTKTDTKNEKESDKVKLLQKDQMQNSIDSDSRNVSDSIIPSASSTTLPKYTSAEVPLHNHMNTNVFNSPDVSKSFVTTKSQAILEIDGSKQTGYSPNTLIFTTAKIHTSDKIKQMEPLQVTPVPILSTTEGSMLKVTSSNNSGQSSTVVTSNVNTMNPNSTNVSEKDNKSKIISPTAVAIKAPEGKIVDNKSFSEKNIHTHDNKNLVTGSKQPSNDLNDSRDNNYISSQGKKEMNEKLTKISTSQPIGVSSAETFKSTHSNVLNKSMNTADTTKAGTTNHTNKTSADRMAQPTKADRTNISKTFEPETDLNKNMKSIESLESSRTVGSDGKSNITSKEKSINSTSHSTKQLQRQKIAIDKDDTKLTSSATNSSPTVLKIATKPQDIVTSVTQTKSPADDVNSLNNITKLPKSSNVHVTSPLTTVDSKLPSSNSTLITTANKPITSNSTTPMRPTVTTHNSTIQVPTSTTTVSNSSSIAKPLSSNGTSKNVTKSGDIISKSPLASTITIKPLISTTSAAEKISTSTVEASIKASSILTTTTKSPSVSTSTKTIPLSTSVSKASPASTTNVKTPSISAKATKVSALPVTVASVTSASVSTTKASSVFANVANDSPQSINSAKTPTSSKSTEKASLTSKTSVQGLDITAVKSPSVSAITKKSAEAEKNIPTISKEKVKSPITSSSKLTSETSTSKDPTLKSLPSNKKGEELSNGNKKLNV